jgi:carbon monoxide dehydrogenase subunit G
MKIHGSHKVPLPPERAYAILQDPVILAACMPGCEGLEKIGEDSYRMKMKMVMAAMSGQFDGKVRITEQNPPASFKLAVEGNGKIGFMKGEGLLTLTADGDQSTDVRYDGDVNVGGTIAAVGQRLIDSTSKMMIKRFFDKLCEKAAASQA